VPLRLFAAAPLRVLLSVSEPPVMLPFSTAGSGSAAMVSWALMTLFPAELVRLTPAALMVSWSAALAPLPRVYPPAEKLIAPTLKPAPPSRIVPGRLPVKAAVVAASFGTTPVLQLATLFQLKSVPAAAAVQVAVWAPAGPADAARNPRAKTQE